MTEKTQTLLLGGADGHLGKKALRYFHQKGLSVIGLCWNEKSRSELLKTLEKENFGSIPLLLCADLSQIDQVERAVSHTLSQFSQIDYLVNVAGGFRWTPSIDATIEDIEFLMNANFKSNWLLAKHVLPEMIAKNFGRIVYVSAACSMEGAGAGMGPYAASKAALNSLVQAISQEIKNHMININVVLPTIIDTPNNRITMPDARYNDWVDPNDLLDTIDFLLSDQSKAIHGSFIKVANRV